MKKEEYLVFEWPGFHLYQLIPPMLAWQQDWGRYGLPLSKMYSTYSKGTVCVYIIKEEYQKSGKRFFERLLKNPRLMDDSLEKVDKAAHEVFKLGKSWQDVDFRKLSNKQLLDLHTKLFKWDNELWKNGQVPSLLEFYNNYLSQHVKELISRVFGVGKTNDIFRILTTFTYHTITERQDEDFVRLLSNKKLLSDPKALRKAIENHWHKYTWMTYGWAGPALTYEYFEETLIQARKNPKIVNQIKSKLKEKTELLKKQEELIKKFEGNDRALVVLLRKILDQKAFRVDAHSMTFFIAERLLTEIGRRIGLSLNQMRAIPAYDVKKIFRKYDLDEVNEQYNLVMLAYEKRKLVKLMGKKALAKLEYVKAHVPKVKAVKELKGELAYAGKTKGKIRVILDIKDANNFKQGEILVSRITDPSFVPLMKKARAIITDVGGITSHAAIVSRELKKICIVGTGIATQVLKDGDMVEVDANKGIVRKI